MTTLGARMPNLFCLTWVVKAVLSVFLLSSAHAQQAKEASGRGCDFASLEKRRQGPNLPDSTSAFVIKQDAPVYANETASVAQPAKLPFNSRVFIAETGSPSGSRLPVKDGGKVVWIERDQLLCSGEPLRDEKTGLFKRLVVKTETTEQGKQPTVRFLRQSPGQDCSTGKKDSCPYVSRFHWYFVYAEDAGYALVGNIGNLGSPDSRLDGWLSWKEEAIPWNTAAGLRPSEMPETRDGPNNQRGAFACAYPTPQIGNRNECRPIFGGDVWFQSPSRMAILAEYPEFYEIAAPAAGVPKGFDEHLRTVAGARAVDVFFVIDGTRSMRSAIEAIQGKENTPGLVAKINGYFKGRLERGGGKIRYGFRVYRDSVDKNRNGIDNAENFTLRHGVSCEGNQNSFLEEFRTVKAVDIDKDDDFPENSFGALDRVGEDLASCPEHLKLVFLIGDHGYSGKAQLAKGLPRAISESDIAKQLKTGHRGFVFQPILTVIQTPSYPEPPEKDYDDAYRLFTSQGRTLLELVYRGTDIREPFGNFFFTLPKGDISDDLITQMMKPIDRVLQPQLVRDVSDALQRGESLEDIVKRLRSSNSANIPALWLDVVVPPLCKELGDQCRTKVFEGVFTGFIPKSKDLEVDILLDATERDDWIQILRVFERYWSEPISADVRNQAVQVVAENIGKRLKITLDSPADEGELGKMLGMAGGLPHAAQSRMAAYTLPELRTIPDCEFRHLTLYAARRRAVLETADGRNIIQFPSFVTPPPDCKASAKALRLEVPTKDYAFRPLPQNLTYRFDVKTANAADSQTAEGRRFYWINNRYLP